MLWFIICIFSVITAYTFYFVLHHKALQSWTRLIHRIPFTEGMGIREDDVLLGADEDSPQLNVEAVAQAEWRLRLFLYQLLR